MLLTDCFPRMACHGIDFHTNPIHDLEPLQSGQLHGIGIINSMAMNIGLAYQ